MPSSIFFKERSELKDVITVLLKDLKATKGVGVRYICSDNAGQSEAFERLCKEEGINV